MKAQTTFILSLLISFIASETLANASNYASSPLDTSASEAENKLYDPTRPNWYILKKKSPNSSSLTLNSLVMSSQRRIAVINGELMREGETKFDVTVQQILPDRVLVTTKTGKKRVLKLKKTSGQLLNKKNKSNNSVKGSRQ